MTFFVNVGFAPMLHNLSIFSFQFSPPSAWLHNPSLSVWLSVYPLSDKYPGVSPYAYCGNNPVEMKDPNGRFPIHIHKEIFQNAVKV